MPFYQFFAVISFDQFATKMTFDQFLSIQSPEASSKWSGCVKAVDLVVQMWQVISTGWTPVMKTCNLSTVTIRILNRKNLFGWPNSSNTRIKVGMGALAAVLP